MSEELEMPQKSTKRYEFTVLKFGLVPVFIDKQIQKGRKKYFTYNVKLIRGNVTGLQSALL